MLIASSYAQAATVQDYVDACTKNTTMDKALCECVANDGRKQLSGKGFDFLVATMQKDQGKSGTLMRQLDQSELMAATMLAMKGPTDCANRGKR